jgi:tyrosinase
MATGAPTPQQLTSPIRFRRRVGALTPGQLSTLRHAFATSMTVSDDTGYAYWAGIHGLPLPISCGNAHGTPYFLPWHRAYLYLFERSLRDRVPDASLTWWDWRTSELGLNPALPTAFAVAKVGTERNPLASAPVAPLALQQGKAIGVIVSARTVRKPHAPGATPLPTMDEVATVLGLSTFLDFTAQLEELHNRVHIWVGGHMGQIPFAAYDPIFWAHHTMIDRIWRLWQLRHPHADPPAALLDHALAPFPMTVRQTLDVTALGYDYAAATASTTGPPT